MVPRLSVCGARCQRSVNQNCGLFVSGAVIQAVSVCLRLVCLSAVCQLSTSNPADSLGPLHVEPFLGWYRVVQGGTGISVAVLSIACLYARQQCCHSARSRALILLHNAPGFTCSLSVGSVLCSMIQPSFKMARC